MYKKLTTTSSASKDAENPSMADITESSSSDGSPASIAPSGGDVTLDKDVDNKTLKQSLYDLKLRIYYMEQKNKYLEDDDGGDIYQKYVDLQTEFEKLKKDLDEKDELLLKAQKVTLYLREEKEKTLYEFQDKEKLYAEKIQQLEKEVEEMKLSDPKFGLHSTTMFMSGGDSVDASSLSMSAAGTFNKTTMSHKRIAELESQLSQLNMELESVKANNDQLEQTVFSLQRKINLSNKEIAELSRELSTLHKERELYVDNCTKRDDILQTMEKQKVELAEKLAKVEQENESLRSALTCSAEQNGSSKNDKSTAVIVQRLLIENKKINARLRKVKEDLLQFYEQCSACAHCANEKKLKKTPTLNLRSPAAAGGTSEDEYEKGSGASQSENDGGECEKYANLGENELKTVLVQRDELIKQLKNELKKRTFNLQELVNKELWDKNREIEKLNKMSDKRKKENDLLRKQLTTGGGGGGASNDNRAVAGGGGGGGGGGYGNAMRELQPCSLRNYKMDDKENVSSMSDDVKLLKEHLRGCLDEKKALLDKINQLESRVAVSDEERGCQSALVHNLRLECVKRKDDFEEAEKARREAFNACALLTSRLEELACFLESLLAHDAAGINAKKRQLLKQAIEKSREISKSFSRTYYNNYATPSTTIAASSTTAALKFGDSTVDSSVPILPDCSEINLSFSGGDDDYDAVAAVRRLPPRRSVSPDFASTEDSEDLRVNDVDVVRTSISFVRHLEPGNELVFSNAGVHKLANEDEDEDDDHDNDVDHLVATATAPANEMQNSVTASSAIVSLDEAPKVGDFDSESETWSEPDRNVSAARIGLTNSASKVYSKRQRSAAAVAAAAAAAAMHRSNSDSDASSCTPGQKYPDVADIRQMQKRIRNLESINESLRRELEFLRSPASQSSSHRLSTAADKKTDMEKLSEKTRLRNLLNKINLENCVDTKKYRDTVEVVRKDLRELCKHLAKTNKLDKFVSLKLKEVCEHFELCELCCSRLHQLLEEAKTRNDVLAELLEETQCKFEQVMADLRTTKLAYNGVILEHEQNIFKYKQCELTNEQLRQQLKSADELCRSLQQQQQQQQQQEEEDRMAPPPIDDALEKASKRIAQLESLVAANDTTNAELERCKRDLVQLGETNEKLLRDVQQLDAFTARVEEYEAQLDRYRENCRRLELELFEKDSMEKLCREQCAKLEEQLREQDTAHRSLKLAGQELREARAESQRLEEQVRRLSGELRDAENARLDRDRQLAVELRNERQRYAALLQQQRDRAERELADKAAVVAQLQQLVDASDQRTRKFENEIQLLRATLDTCELEKREFRAKIAAQVDEHETLKKEHEQKMKHLLGQIIAYRTEEESSLAAHRELVHQIEQAQNKKHLWKKSIREWKDKYEQLKMEKQHVEHQLHARCDDRRRLDNLAPSPTTADHGDGQLVQSAAFANNNADVTLIKLNVERDWLAREAELRYQVDVATLTTSHVILEWTRLANEKLRLQRELHRRDKPLYVHHLETIKCQLEKRVKELESANHELESRLQRLQSSKITPSDFDLSSEEEEEEEDAAAAANQPQQSASVAATIRFPSAAKLFSSLDSPAAAYSSFSLPSSPNRSKRASSPLLSSSVPSSPTRLKNDYFASAASDMDRVFGCQNDDSDSYNTNKSTCVAVRKLSGSGGENSATSPDLGIDSDHGRNSISFEFDSGNGNDNGNGGETNIRCEIINLEEENKRLKRELGQTKKELEETLGKLTTLNKNKKRMEKAIFKQIFETKHILKRARVNLEDGTATATVTAAGTAAGDDVDAAENNAAAAAARVL